MASNYSVGYETVPTGSTTPVTSKTDFLVTIFKGPQHLTIVRESSVLDITGVLELTLIADLFASQS